MHGTRSGIHAEFLQRSSNWGSPFCTRIKDVSKKPTLCFVGTANLLTNMCVQKMCSSKMVQFLFLNSFKPLRDLVFRKNRPQNPTDAFKNEIE